MNRYDRISEEIKRGISEIIRELKDPRIAEMTSIMSAEVPYIISTWCLNLLICLKRLKVTLYLNFYLASDEEKR